MPGSLPGQRRLPFPIVEGIPSELNRLLAAGEIDVSPSSSIEYAFNPGRYLILPGLSITSQDRGTEHHSAEPGADGGAGREDAWRSPPRLPRRSFCSASCSSSGCGQRPSYSTFQQGTDDPFGKVDAMLFIGDHALRTRATAEYPHLFDLGSLWHRFTGLPFVFALWQVNYKKTIDKDLAMLYDVLMRSKQYGLSHIPGLAASHAARFGLPEQLLSDYWTSFSYDLTDYEKTGLQTFYRYAAEIGAVGPVGDISIWEGR